MNNLTETQAIEDRCKKCPQCYLAGDGKYYCVYGGKPVDEIPDDDCEVINPV